MTKTKLFMLCGVPTCGKSTFVSGQRDTMSRQKTPPIILSTDAHIEKYAKDRGLTYNEAFSDAIDSATTLFNAELRRACKAPDGSVVIIDQTNLTKKSRRRKLAKFPQAWEKVAIWFEITLEEALRRNKYSRPGKVIPEKLLRSMYESFEIPSKAEGFDEVIRVVS